MAEQTASPTKAQLPEKADGASDVGRARLPMKLVLGVTAAVLSVSATAWYFLRDQGLPPEQRLQLALKYIRQRESPRALAKAEQIARDLQEIEYRDPDFAGAVEFLLGIAAFRGAESGEPAYGEQGYLQTVTYLREADKRVLDQTWRPEWAYALGVSLHRVGSASKARPLLEEAAQTFEPGRVKTSILLCEIYLDLNAKKELDQALELNNWVIQQESLTQADHDRAYLQRAQILNLLGHKDDAEKALEQVSQETNKKHGSTMMNVQTLMSEGEYERALSLLEPLATATVLDEFYMREALFRMGFCSEKLAETAGTRDAHKLRIDAAISYYERTSQKFPISHESLVANLRVAELFRTYQPTPRNEEALENYRQALRAVRDPDDFRNRWLSLDEFRQDVLRAWNDWIKTHSYAEAIALTGFMVPLFPEEEASGLAARVNQHWAEFLQGQLETAPYSQRPPLETQLRVRWRASGRAFADLAETLRVTSQYAEFLWTSADHYYRGHDYSDSLKQLNKFIALQQQDLLPPALVRKGEILMHLDRLDEAITSFQKVLDTYPTDSAFFRAQYVIGQCFLEHNDAARAEQAWRDILTSESLTPAAEEWRLALFALGRLLYYQAGTQQKNSTDETPQEETQRVRIARDDGSGIWSEAISRFDEYLERYPSSDEAVEARYLLAESLVQSAKILRVELASAETENARFELRQRDDALLNAATAQFRVLQADLAVKQRQDELNVFGQRVLRDSYFEMARTLFDRNQFDQAVAAYRTATYKYPDDPQVLLAYIQMAHCFNRLGKPDEAQSLLEQAKVILRDLPEETFRSTTTSLRVEDWQQWIQWAEQMYKFAENHPATSSTLH